MPLPPPPPAHVVRVEVPSAAAARRLQRLGLDTNEAVVDGRATVVLRATRDGRRLRAAGFTPEAPPAPRGTRQGGGALPSGRTSYRTLDDYEHDMDALVAAHPGLVRIVTLPGTSVLGRPIHGVEIAVGVDRTDDGRATVLEAGLHHAREWSSGEMVLEHAIDLARGAASDPRIARIVAGVRTVVVPVMNPDGLVASQALGGDPYKRKNCAGGIAGACGDGVDLNRNYGAFWGGPGASGLAGDSTYRGPSPFSEPEVRALRDFAAARQLALVNMTHNFGGQVLWQPGFDGPDEPGLPAGAAVPHRDRMAEVGTALARSAGYTAGPAYSLYDATGAAEDLTYFAQGAFGYTTEVAGSDFHGAYASDVIGGWPGMRELFLRAAEAALDPANHATITGTAPPGATLTLGKDVTLSTSYVDGGPALPFTEHVASTLTVPRSGRFTWAVNPSTPPLVSLAGGAQPWLLSCPGETRRVTVGLGAKRKVALGCGTSVLAITSVRRSARRLIVRLHVTGGPLTRLRATLAGRVTRRARAGSRITLHTPRPGRYRLRVSASAPDGHRVAAVRRIRVRR